jgi:rhodanese-related sulfurtransferase
MNRLINSLFVFMFLTSLIMGGSFLQFAYKKGWLFADFDSIGAKKVVRLLDEKNNNIVILDVRSDQEYNRRHLERAIHIPMQVLSERMDTLKNEKEKQILVYCKSGNRSVKASRILAENGYQPLNVQGGMRQLIRSDAKLVY